MNDPGLILIVEVATSVHEDLVVEERLLRDRLFTAKKVLDKILNRIRDTKLRDVHV